MVFSSVHVWVSGELIYLLSASFSQSVHQLLPPTYRDVWLEWRDSEQQQQEASRTAANKPRDQFISRLLTRLKQQQNQSNAQQPTYQDGPGFNNSGEEEPEDSWENLANLNIEEKENKAEEKSKKSREWDGGLKAARELLLKLKESPIAKKLQVKTLSMLFHSVFHVMKCQHIYQVFNL